MITNEILDLLQMKSKITYEIFVNNRKTGNCKQITSNGYNGKHDFFH